MTFAIIGSSIIGVSPAFAQTSNTGSTIHPNFLQGIIDAIAQKFGLDKTQVQSVITYYQNSQKANFQSNMQNREKSRLDKLVSAGNITQDQEKLILAKFQELQSSRQNWKSLTPDQRKAAMMQQKTDLQNWAKQNNIDPKYLLFGKMHPRGGMRGIWGK